MLLLRTITIENIVIKIQTSKKDKYIQKFKRLHSILKAIDNWKQLTNGET